MAVALSLGLIVDVIGSTAAAAAERKFTLDIPAENASAALAAIASTTGVAVGWQGGIPPLTLHAVRGTLTIADALHVLLEGSGYVAERVGSQAFRIVRAPPPPRATTFVSAPPRRRLRLRTAPILAVGQVTPTADIVVTGQKRPQTLRDIPLSVSVIMLEGPGIGTLQPGTREVFAAIDGVSMTNLGPGRNRVFIRGVADSPFNGTSQSTVAVQVDEARVTYDAPDPDLRLIDMERVEVLKGPQGALYGSGALGGIYHLVTRRPDLESISGSAHAGGEAVEHGGFGPAGDITLNLPLVRDHLAVRGVGYGAREAGWIDDIGRRPDINAAHVVGGRVAVRWRPVHAWNLDLSGAYQNVATRDSQYVTASRDTLRRVAPVNEPSDNTFKSVAATISGKVGTVNVLATSSYVWQQVDTTLNSTAVSTLFLLRGRSRFTDHRLYQVRNHEVRLASAGPLRWLVGASYLDARSDLLGIIASRTESVRAETRDRRVREYAGFTELTVPLMPGVTGVVGGRLSRALTADVTSVRTGGRVDSSSSTQFAPSGALSWKPDTRTVVYLRYARAIRPGGLAITGRAPGEPTISGRPRFRQFASDELGSFDLGIRRGGPSDRLSLSASAFATDWRHIQTDYLLASGLISTRNAGRGRILGAEASVDWRPSDAVLLTTGMSYVDAKLVRDEAGKRIAHRRLPVTPDLTARARAQYGFNIGTWAAKVEAQANYIGTSKLSFDPPFDRTMGDYATVALGVMATHGHFALSASVDNVLDGRGNTFAFGNPFSLGTLQQYTPQRPRTVSLSLARNW